MKTPPDKSDDKKPLNPRDEPLARDQHGKASREEIRKVTPQGNGARQSDSNSKRS